MLDFDNIVDAWQRRELPLLLIRVGGKLADLYGSRGHRVAEYLDMLFGMIEEEFILGSNMHHLGEILADGGTPLLLRHLTIVSIVTPGQAIAQRRLKRSQASSIAYQRWFREIAEASHGALSTDFFERIMKVPLDLLEYRVRRTMTARIGQLLASDLAQIVRATMQMECWDQLHDLNHAHTKTCRELRAMQAWPLWIESNGTTTLLVAQPT